MQKKKISNFSESFIKASNALLYSDFVINNYLTIIFNKTKY